jgi:hypothetical protein
MNKFYDSVINTENEIGAIFDSLNTKTSIQNWKIIQTKFHESIDRNFPAITCDINSELAEERNPIPERLIKRIKVVTLLLSVLVLGGTYNEKLYLKMVDFSSIKKASKPGLALNNNS